MEEEKMIKCGELVGFWVCILPWLVFSLVVGFSTCKKPNGTMGEATKLLLWQ
jgi:hypothetical protein